MSTIDREIEGLEERIQALETELRRLTAELAAAREQAQQLRSCLHRIINCDQGEPTDGNTCLCCEEMQGVAREGYAMLGRALLAVREARNPTGTPPFPTPEEDHA